MFVQITVYSNITLQENFIFDEQNISDLRSGGVRCGDDTCPYTLPLHIRPLTLRQSILYFDSRGSRASDWLPSLPRIPLIGYLRCYEYPKLPSDSTVTEQYTLSDHTKRFTVISQVPESCTTRFLSNESRCSNRSKRTRNTILSFFLTRQESKLPFLRHSPC